MKRVAILTESGPLYGSGHLQRMALLADYLEKSEEYSPSLITGSSLPDKISHLRETMIPTGTDLIIRDMRDSASEEILKLRQKAPVLVIDDMGPGSKNANFSLNLLPSPEGKSDDPSYRPGAFLYGYNFASALQKMEHRTIKRNIDISIYCGADPTEDTISYFKSLIPENFSACLLRDNSGVPLTSSTKLKPGISSTEALLSSRILLTYFGITLYEGFASGCRLAVADPGDYHNRLTEQASHLGATNLGTWGKIDSGKAREIMKNKNVETENAKPAEVYTSVIRNCMELKNIIDELLIRR